MEPIYIYACIVMFSDDVVHVDNMAITFCQMILLNLKHLVKMLSPNTVLQSQLQWS